MTDGVQTTPAPPGRRPRSRRKQVVEIGLGVAILPRFDAEGPGAEVAVVALTEPRLQRDITLAWREGRRHPPAAAEFLDLARATYGGEDPTPDLG